MGQETTRCCCKSKETNEINIGNSKTELIEYDGPYIPKLNKDVSMKDLKSYITNKNNSNSKEENNGNSTENKEEIKKNSKKNILKKEVKEFDLPPLPKKKIGHKNSSVKKVSFIDSNMKKENKNNNNENINKNNENNINEKKENKNINDKKNIPYLIKIQSVYKGYYYRKKIYPNVKKELEQNLLEELKTLTEKYLTPNLKSQEEKLGISQDENTYKSLIKETEKKKKKNIFFTKLLKLKYNNKNGFYIGETTINNSLEGIGILTLENGIKYMGTFEKNKLKKGKIIDEEGIYYEGIFNDNLKLEGSGKKISLNNSVYIGDFNNGLKEGKGNEETNEHIYEGNFKNDKKNGYGKIYYKEMKDHYEGEFEDNKITGNGKYFWYNGEIYEGKLVNGKMHGKGIYTWPDGGKYEGDYIDNTKEGNGIFKWPNGKIFEGPFVNGKPHGEGFLTNKNKKFKVTFIDGKINSNVKEYKNSSNSSISFVSDVQKDKSNNDDNSNNKNKKKKKSGKKNSKDKDFKGDKSLKNNYYNDNKNNINNDINNNNIDNNNEVKNSKKKKKRIITEKDLENF